MKLVLDIKDNKASAFINFIKSLDFISIKEKVDQDEPTKEAILDGIKKGVKEIQLYESGEIELQSAKDFLHEL